MTGDLCSVCGSTTGVARSPTGDWCNDCGDASPGLDCKTCGRVSVNPMHTNWEGELCKTELVDKYPNGGVRPSRAPLPQKGFG